MVFIFIIVWFLSNLMISSVLCFVIVKFISNKTLVLVSIVDLIYRDSIIYLLFLCSTATAGFIHCLLKDGSLSFTLSATYSGITIFFVDCLCISLIFGGSLRLISLLRNSEVGGLQLLGPENIAILKIRMISIVISFSFQIVMIFSFEAQSGLFNMFYESETKSYSAEITKNRFKALYWIWPISAVLLHIANELISYKLKIKLNQCDQVLPIFTIVQQPMPTTESFHFSTSSVIGFPFAIMFAFVLSFASRHNRLLFFYPVESTVISVILPLGIIYKNKKMKTYLEQIVIIPLKDKFMFVYFEFKRIISSKVSPLLY